ncbi:hypothetical protein [Thalassobellus suaedae]|uniref:RagB/SusD domain-containing protein n=1 Tax=Thalassobellus suaedae TaxID=3074124 RepID=A0ABY9XU33_9FLAO|nr:hypothetical protein RHP51_00535 [Flavobacteriaceae bacterium HL-DH14]
MQLTEKYNKKIPEDRIFPKQFLQRFDDIRRWGWLQYSAKLAWLKSRDAEFETYSNGREYFPIPQSEMDNNPLVNDQNDGY